MSRFELDVYVGEGEKAFIEGRTSSECPYSITVPARESWMFGFWRKYYEQRALDTEHIASWLILNIHEISSPIQANGIAHFITHLESYDRTRPIKNNRIAGHEFDIPAPITL